MVVVCGVYFKCAFTILTLLLLYILASFAYLLPFDSGIMTIVKFLDIKMAVATVFK